MQIEFDRSQQRGVTELQYVGDDAQAAIDAPSSRWWWVAGGLLAAAYLFSRPQRRR